MKKIMYFIKVVIFSLEFLLTLFSVMAVYFFEREISETIKLINFNSDFMKYLVVLPLGIFVWIIKESKDIVVAEKDNIKILVNWPDYWKFKIHLNATLIFGLFFSLLSCVPWVRRAGMADAIGIMSFLTGALGIFVTASCIYFAQISLKEIFNKDF